VRTRFYSVAQPEATARAVGEPAHIARQRRPGVTRYLQMQNLFRLKRGLARRPVRRMRRKNGNFFDRTDVSYRV
jgi:hypothetical protein